jgi:prephenate dehydrogenase
MHRISIIGLGLMGGSIAKGLKKRAPDCQIASLSADFADLHKAVQTQTVDIVFQTWEELIGWSDLIVLATPLSTLSGLAIEIGRRCNKRLLVIDVGSVKKAVIPTFEAETRNDIEFLSTHPMAGKERWGFEQSDPDLFERCCWMVSPHAKNTPRAIQAVSKWIELFGAKPLLMSPEIHDKKVALISHLPALISRRLLDFVEAQDPEALQIAGPGFHSMTRLARDNPQLHSDIFAWNQEQIDELLKQWRNQ